MRSECRRPRHAHSNAGLQRHSQITEWFQARQAGQHNLERGWGTCCYLEALPSTSRFTQIYVPAAFGIVSLSSIVAIQSLRAAAMTRMKQHTRHPTTVLHACHHFRRLESEFMQSFCKRDVCLKWHGLQLPAGMLAAM